MKAIIFGINGQDGFYLQEILKKNNLEVIGVSRSFGNWIIGNIADYKFVYEVIKKHRPKFIFHLAANSTTNHSALFENHETISTGTLNILESVLKLSPKTKVFISGSGLQFKNTGEAISENTEFEARDAYSVARIQSVYAARYYKSLGLDIYVGYFFNHDSPLRTERHINQMIVSAVKKIANGSNEMIEIGDFNVRKEFSFAGDIAEAIWIFINNNNHFEAVIGSGKAYSIQDWLNICFNYYELDWKNHIIKNPKFKSDYEILVSDPKTIINLGWTQKVEINDLAKMMIEHG